MSDREPCHDCGGTGFDVAGLTDELGRVIDCETCDGTGEATEDAEPDDGDRVDCAGEDL